jgi:hypothetical protein
MKFIAGLIVGFGLGCASLAGAASLVGSHGYLMGYDVKVNGRVVCSDPWVWTGGLNEIECDTK